MEWELGVESGMPMPARRKLVADIVDVVETVPLNRMPPPHQLTEGGGGGGGTVARVHRQRKSQLKKTKNETLENLGTKIQLRCTAIQKFLLEETSGSERRIRETFGDNPDTSKALRMLVKQHRVKRFGTGGKADPFVYMALIPPGMIELQRLQEASAVGII